MQISRFFIDFLFLSDDGPMLETLDYTICIGGTPNFHIQSYLSYSIFFLFYFIIVCLIRFHFILYGLDSI